MSVLTRLNNVIEKSGAAYLILVDPDKINGDKLKEFAVYAENSGVDGFLIGGSLMVKGYLQSAIDQMKSVTSLPVIIFPGSAEQVLPNADAILFLSLISGRNPQYLIGQHVIAAPYIKKINLEAISTGYMIIESGRTTTAEYISGSKPVPRNKPEIAAATALAAQYLGMKCIYLEAGSGAEMSVPDEMVKMVSGSVNIPVIVGGGIRTAAEARSKVENGAKIIITGNYFEEENNWQKIKDFAGAVHIKSDIKIQE